MKDKNTLILIAFYLQFEGQTNIRVCRVSSWIHEYL